MECVRYDTDQYIAFRQELFSLCVGIKSMLNTKNSKNNKHKATEANPICMAMIINILEKITNKVIDDKKSKNLQSAKNPKEHKIPLSYSEIASLLYNAFCEEAIISSLSILIQAKYIKRYDINGKKPTYVLNIPVLQAALDKQAGKDQVALDEQTGKDQVQTVEPSVIEPVEPNHPLLNERQLQTIGHTTKKKYTEKELRSFLELNPEFQLEALLSQKMRETFDNWCSIHKGPVPLIPKRFLALQDLEPFDTSIEILKDVLKYCYATDKQSKQYPKGYYHVRGVDLWDIAERYPQWSQTKEYQDSSPVQTTSKSQSSISDQERQREQERQRAILKKRVRAIMEKLEKEGKSDLPDYIQDNEEWMQWAQEWKRERIQLVK